MFQDYQRLLLMVGNLACRYRDEEAEAAAAAAALGPVRQSQGADLSQLLAQAEPFDRAFYFRWGPARGGAVQRHSRHARGQPPVVASSTAFSATATNKGQSCHQLPSPPASSCSCAWGPTPCPLRASSPGRAWVPSHAALFWRHRMLCLGASSSVRMCQPMPSSAALG